MKTALDVKKVGSNAAKFGSAAAGLVAGSILMKQVPKTNIAFGGGIIDKILPGVLGMLVAYLVGTKVSDDRAKAACLGLGLAGFADLTKKAVGDKLPSFLNDSLPALSGVPMQGVPFQGFGNNAAAVNDSSVPASYYLENAFQGLGNSGYALGGAPGFALN